MKNKAVVKDIQYTSVFDRTLKSKARIILNLGGAGSSKSYSMAQLFLYKMMSESNKRFLVCRKYRASVRESCLRTFEQLLSEYGVGHLFIKSKSAKSYTYPWTGSYLVFDGLYDSERVKSSEWNYIWVEEASEILWSDFLELKRRLRAPSKDGVPNQIFLTSNPVSPLSWLKTMLPMEDNFEMIHSTYKDNPFLDEEYVRDLERLKDISPEHYQIYALGQYASVQGLIYPNYEVIDEWPDNLDDIFFGLDFGYNNPTALVMCGVKENNLYVHEVLYQSELTNRDLIEHMKEIEELQGRLIYPDSAEPARIQELQNEGFLVIPADKGKDSVTKGIDLIKTYKLYITKQSSNILKEISGYGWQQDKDGRFLDVPVKFNDHAMDAMRYAFYTHLKNRNVRMEIRWL